MTQFKVGDKVKCISLKGFKADSISYIVEQGIGIGDILTISSVKSNYAYNDGLETLKFNEDGFYHPASSFKLIEP